MTLREKINAEYMSAFKNRETVKKNILGVLRGEITTMEKSSGAAELSEGEITKLLLKYKKNIEESRRLQDTLELSLEQEVIESFLPQPMSEAEIRREVSEIFKHLPPGLPANALAGKTMGEFNKKFPGAADTRTVMSIIQENIS
jgi:uncharacterized protein YqeY